MSTGSGSVSILIRACLHGGGGPQTGEVTCGGSPHLTCKRDQIKMRDYMDRWDTSPKRVTSPTWGSPPPGKQALNLNALRNRALGLNEFVNKCNGRDTH